MPMPRDSVTDPRTASDDQLLADYAAGRSGAAGEMTARFLPLAYRLALRMLGQAADAEDVAQEAMLRLFRQAPSWQAGRARVGTWLYRVTANLCADQGRRRRFAPIEAADAVAAPGLPADEALTDRARVAALHAAIATLPDRQRLALVLRHLEGLGNPEIAAIMDVGVEAVESLVARGRRRLAELLAGRRAELGYGGEDD